MTQHRLRLLDNRARLQPARWVAGAGRPLDVNEACGRNALMEAPPKAGCTRRGGKLMCTYFEENILPLFPAEHVDGLFGCLDYYQGVGDRFSRALLERYDRLYPGGAKLIGGSAATGMYRGL